jgi:HK97 family phage major capsid protein|tara:strand:+ start:99 stop:1421 length:1323 start_codon:yes stop_codon:yes gene_type:complete
MFLNFKEIYNMSFDEGRLNELKDALSGKMGEQQELADSIQLDGETLVVGDEQRSAFNSNMAQIKELKGLIEDITTLRDVSAWSSEAEYKSVAAEVAAGVEAEVAHYKAQSVGEAFVNSEEFKSLQGGKSGANMASPFVTKSLEQKDIYSGLPTGTPSAFGAVERDGIIPIAQRRSRVRDLFPARSTNAAVIEYFRQTGFTNAADTVAERSGSNFGAKPESSMTFVGEQAPVRTIAHWEAAHRNVLADEPQLRSIIDNELLYGLRLTEDTQILSGSGTGEDLAGILNNSSVQTYSWSSGATTPVADTKADAVRRAATLAYLAYYEPTGIIVNPNDWEDIELTKNSQGTYLLAISVAGGAESRIWRIPVIDTPAIASGTALIGAFGTGAQLYDREAASIRISEQHSDFFVRNAVVVLAEERLALAVKRPESFVKVTFDAKPS